MKIFNIILIPYHLLVHFILKPLSRLILKNEISYYNNRLKKILEFKDELHKVCEQQKDQINELERRRNRIKYIINQNQNKTCEISLTEQDEIVIITFDKKNVFDYIKIYGENGEHPYFDCQVALQTFGNNLKICDFTSCRKGFGYGKRLLDFTIDKAKENSFDKIHGDLSFEDKERFNRLLPFYKSFGFRYTIFENSNRPIIGKIEMKLI